MPEFQALMVGWVPKEETEAETLSEGGIHQDIIRSSFGDFVYKTKNAPIKDGFPSSKKVRVEIKVIATVTEIDDDDPGIPEE